MEPRSSRLKEKRGDGVQLIKKLFVQNVIQDNELLSCLLNDGSSCIVLPITAHDGPGLSALRSRYKLRPKSNLSDDIYNSGETLKYSRCLLQNEAFDLSAEIRNCSALSSSKEMPLPVSSAKKYPSNLSTSPAEGDEAGIISAAGLLDQGLLSCVSCGILSFSCVAVIKPKECSSSYFMSSDDNFINDKLVASGESHLVNATGSEGTGGGTLRPLLEPSVNEILSDAEPVNRNSALDPLVAAYGDQSDRNEDIGNRKLKVSHESMELSGQMTEPQHNVSSNICFDGTKISSNSDKFQQRPSTQSSQFVGGSSISNGPRGVRTRNKYKLKQALSEGFQLKDNRLTMEQKVLPESPSSNKILKEEPLDASGTDFDARCNNTAVFMDDPRSSAATVNNLNKPVLKFDKDSSRMHVFCLEHALDVKKQLLAIGGANVILLCRPEYLKIEAEARSLAAEMEVEYGWKDIHFREGNTENREMIQELLQDVASIPTSSDWTVKLGANLYYSANLAKSPTHTKQIPYNRVIYRAFGCDSPTNSPEELQTCESSQGRQMKIVIAGRWCGKVWMSDQVHPILAQRTAGGELEETDDDLSRVAASKRKSSTATAVRRSIKKRENMTLEETDAKRPKRTEYSSKVLKGAAQMSSPSPAGVVLPVSSRIVSRPNKVKSEMAEEGPASRPKSKVTVHLRRRQPPMTEFQAGKQMKISRGHKMMAPSAVNDEEEQQFAGKGSPRKHRTRTEAKIQLKKATGKKKKTTRDQVDARSVVHLVTEFSDKYDNSLDRVGFGTGFVVQFSAEAGVCLIMTCRHVVEGASVITVNHRKRTFNGAYVQVMHGSVDLAIVRLPVDLEKVSLHTAQRCFKPLSFAEVSDDVTSFVQPVRLISCLETLFAEVAYLPAVSTGYIGGSLVFKGNPCYHATYASEPGSSGGPVLISHKVVAVNCGRSGGSRVSISLRAIHQTLMLWCHLDVRGRKAYHRWNAPVASLINKISFPENDFVEWWQNAAKSTPRIRSSILGHCWDKWFASLDTRCYVGLDV